MTHKMVHDYLGRKQICRELPLIKFETQGKSYLGDIGFVFHT